MIKEEKKLLLQDLCARVSYGVRVLVQSHKGTFHGTLVTVTTKLSGTLGEAWIEETDEALWCDYSLFKPYLRPLSSMTEEEKKIMRSCGFELISYDTGCIGFANIENCIDEVSFRFMEEFLNSHHFDYRELIEKGLAIEAPENMYKTE